MIRVLLLLSLIVFTSVCVIYYQSPSVVKNFYSQKLVNPRSWGKIEVTEEKPIGSLKYIFQSELVWQILEQLVGFVTGVLICVLIGWRVSSYRNIYEKSFENQLIECLQRQNRFEKQLSALELQIIDFERTYLFTHQKTSERCDSFIETSISPEESTQSTKEEVDGTYKKDNQYDKNEGLVRQAVEAVMRQECDDSNFECILEKLTKILERLSKLSKEKIFPALESDNALVKEQAAEIDANEEFYEKESLEVESKTDEVEEVSEKIEESEDQTTTSPEDVEDITYQCPDVICDNTPYELHSCKSNEKISNVVIEIIGGGECDETFRGKIVPVSQIPKYQEIRKQRVNKPQKECDDEKLIPFVASRNTPEHVMSERATPQASPRKNNSSPLERSASRGGRRKQRS